MFITAALISVSRVVSLPVPFPGVPLAGRAVVNGASGAVSALVGRVAAAHCCAAAP
ncbi:transporter [Enterobacter ludwigii]|uniref:transporter n=1 Tax=Enterobacter ludwigii TaxID=299767 RepID=UPI002FF822D0